MAANLQSIIGLAQRRYELPLPFGIHLQDRLLHLYLVGQTGTGKSTLLYNLAHQDAASGRGFCLIDPHGDLAEALHNSLRSAHIYWDIANPVCQYGYNPLAPVSPPNRPLVASGLIETLKLQWPDAWGARMEHILRYSILALLELPETDLRDIVRLLVFKGFRRQVVEKIAAPQVLFFWRHEFPALNHQQGDGTAPIANKLGAFLAQPEVLRSLCEPLKPLRFRSIMDTGQVLIINLAKGRLGADISNVVGGLVASSLMHAAFSRHGLPEASRVPFFLYADEFHNFTTKAFSDLLPEARKYGLGLVLAHQHIAQTSKPIFESILGNIGSTAVFRVGPRDAIVFDKQLFPFTANDLSNQPNHRAAVQIMHQGTKLRPFSASMYPPHHGSV